MYVYGFIAEHISNGKQCCTVVLKTIWGVTGKPGAPEQLGSTRKRLIFAIRIWLVATSSRSVRVRVRFSVSNQSWLISKN